MKKSFNFYAVIWAICLVLFNILSFVTPNEIAGISKFDGSFWIGYVFITIGFIGQLVCAYTAFKADNLKKLFYNIPLINISYTGLVVMLIVGGIAMAIPQFPEWLGVIICFVVLAISIIAVLTAKVAIDAVSAIDEKIAKNTAFIKSLTLDAQSLMNRANAPMLKEKCKRVYEALRYSDPVSSEQLSYVENQIKNEFDLLTDAVLSDDLDKTEIAVKEILTLISKRNNKAKLLKQRGI